MTFTFKDGGSPFDVGFSDPNFGRSKVTVPVTQEVKQQVRFKLAALILDASACVGCNFCHP